jgi:hypothetical protein
MRYRVVSMSEIAAHPTQSLLAQDYVGKEQAVESFKVRDKIVVTKAGDPVDNVAVGDRGVVLGGPYAGGRYSVFLYKDKDVKIPNVYLLPEDMELVK